MRELLIWYYFENIFDSLYTRATAIYFWKQLTIKGEDSINGADKFHLFEMVLILSIGRIVHLRKLLRKNTSNFVKKCKSPKQRDSNKSCLQCGSECWKISGACNKCGKESLIMRRWFLMADLRPQYVWSPNQESCLSDVSRSTATALTPGLQCKCWLGTPVSFPL